MSNRVKEISDADFELSVLERSKEIPVVIDLWAPWCGPCRTLGPILEKVAADRSEEFELVKLNVDENPRVASALGARSIPLVVAFRDGEPVGAFVGAQPASAVNQFIDQIQPKPADRKVAEAGQASERGDAQLAEQLLMEAIELDSRHVRARVELARLHAGAGRFDAALETLKPLPSSGHDEVAHLRSEIRMKMSSGDDLEALRERVAANPEDIDALVELGKALGTAGAHGEALEMLLAAVTKSPEYGSGMARQAMLDLFEVIGQDAAETKEYRRKLASVLH